MATLLNYYGIAMQKIIGTAVFNALITTLVALLGFAVSALWHSHYLTILFQIIDWQAVFLIVPTGIVGVYIGSRLVRRVPATALQFILVGVLFMSGLLVLIR